MASKARTRMKTISREVREQSFQVPRNYIKQGMTTHETQSISHRFGRLKLPPHRPTEREFRITALGTRNDTKVRPIRKTEAAGILTETWPPFPKTVMRAWRTIRVE